MASEKGPRRVRKLRRGIVILPNAFTLGNLFFGFWAIVSAIRGEFVLAAWLVLLAAVADGLDGRIARFSSTGSPFGVELDSLIDLVSFGIAPGLVIYTLYLAGSDWGWTLSFIYVSSVAMRLARFNIEQGGRAKVNYHGLPSPVAGVTLAWFYPFSQTALFADHLAGLPWPRVVAGGMIVLAGLMLSHVLYPAIPPISLRTVRGRVGLGALLVSAALLSWHPRIFVFVIAIVYILYGAFKGVTLGLLDRLPERDPFSEEFEAEEETETRDLEYEEMTPQWNTFRNASQRGAGIEADDDS